MKKELLWNLSFSLLAAAVSLGGVAQAGNGEGHNGPTLSPISVPGREERGVSLEVAKKAVEACTYVGDTSRGVKSLGQKLGETVFAMPYVARGNPVRMSGSSESGDEFRYHAGSGLYGGTVHDGSSAYSKFKVLARRLEMPRFVNSGLYTQALTNPHQVARDPEATLFKKKEMLYDRVIREYRVSIMDDDNDRRDERRKEFWFTKSTWTEVAQGNKSPWGSYYTACTEKSTFETRALVLPEGVYLPRIVYDSIETVVDYDELMQPKKYHFYLKKASIEASASGQVALLNKESGLETPLKVDFDAYADCLKNEIQAHAGDPDVGQDTGDIAGDPKFHGGM